MLEIGNGISIPESRTHFALWAAMKSPLLIGTDLSRFNEQDTEIQILKNRHLLAFNQDPNIGEPAKPYKWGTNPDWTFDDAHPPEYWSGSSTAGTLALVANTDEVPRNKTIKFTEIPELVVGRTYRAIDVWTDLELGCINDEIVFEILPHDTAVVLLVDDCPSPMEKSRSNDQIVLDQLSSYE
jgi:alpha-galactosidase